MQQGFQNSATRTTVEIGVVVSVVVGAVLLVVWLASHAAAYLAPLVPSSVDEAVGEAAWGQVAPVAKRCVNPEPLAYVEELSQPLLRGLGPSAPKVRFAVIDEADPNAFALPGGFVTVHLGLLTQARSGAEVAAVLAHELAHVRERHSMQRVLRGIGTSLLFSVFLGAADLGALGGYAESLTHLAYDRGQESEADDVGRELLLAARYPTDGLSTFFRRLAEQQGDTNALTTLLSSHPALEERARAADSHAPRKDVITPPAPPVLACKTGS